MCAEHMPYNAKTTSSPFSSLSSPFPSFDPVFSILAFFPCTPHHTSQRTPPARPVTQPSISSAYLHHLPSPGEEMSLLSWYQTNHLSFLFVAAGWICMNLHQSIQSCKYIVS